MDKHQASFYRTEDEFVSDLVPFVLEGVESGEAVFAVGIPENVDALRSALGNASNEVLFGDAMDWYVKPAQTIGAYLWFINEQLAAGRHGVRIVGEVVWPDRYVDLQREWIRYEISLNSTLADLPVWTVCTYNIEHLAPSRIDAARATHPYVIEHGVVSASESYTSPDQMLVDQIVRMPLPTRDEGRRFDAGDIVGPIAWVIEHARRAGLTEDVQSNVAAAVSEIVEEATAHASGPVLVAAWIDEGGDFVCQIEDENSTPPDPLAGYRPPPLPDAPDDWGLWLARHLSDLLEVGIGSRGTAVRLKMRRSLA